MKLILFIEGEPAGAKVVVLCISSEFQKVKLRPPHISLRSITYSNLHSDFGRKKNRRKYQASKGRRRVGEFAVAHVKPKIKLPREISSDAGYSLMRAHLLPPPPPTSFSL